jgi:hypothetical protein
MSTGITVFADAASYTVQTTTAEGVRILSLYYRAKGGDETLPQAEQLRRVAQMIARDVMGVAETQKRADYLAAAGTEADADGLGELSEA